MRPQRKPVLRKVDELYDLVEDTRVAMLTTRRRDGSLVSRPMAAQRRMDGAHFWFVTAEGHPKLAEISFDPNVNLAYYKDRARQWVSVAGLARVIRDRARIRELYEPSWKAWFPDEGEPRNGGPDDPRMVLVAVEARSAHSMAANGSTAVTLFEHVSGWSGGEIPETAFVPAGVELG